MSYENYEVVMALDGGRRTETLEVRARSAREALDVAKLKRKGIPAGVKLATVQASWSVPITNLWSISTPDGGAFTVEAASLEEAQRIARREHRDAKVSPWTGPVASVAL